MLHESPGRTVSRTRMATHQTHGNKRLKAKKRHQSHSRHFLSIWPIEDFWTLFSIREMATVRLMAFFRRKSFDAIGLMSRHKCATHGAIWRLMPEGVSHD